MQRDSASIGMNPRLGLLLLQIRCFMDHWQEQLRDELASEKVVTAALLETLQCELARAPPQACYLKTLGLTWCRLSHVFSLPPLPAISPCGFFASPDHRAMQNAEVSGKTSMWMWQALLQQRLAQIQARS